MDWQTRGAPLGRTTRRAVLGAAASGAGLGVLAACGGTAAEPQGLKVHGPVTLRYIGSFAPSSQTTFAGGAQRLVELFNERAAPIKVEPIMPPGNRYEAALAMITSGEQLDLLHALPREYHPFANIGALAEIDPYIKKDKRAQDVLSLILDYWSRGDKHYAMPNNWSPHALYFNKDIFLKAGVKTPDQYEKEGKWTYDVYREVAQKLTTGTGENKIYGAPWTTNALDQQLSFIWPFGGDVFDKALQTTTLDSAEALEAIQFQADMTHKYGVSFDADVMKQTGWRGSGGAISAGRAGMEIMTTDVVGMLVPTTFDKGMAPIPKGKTGRVVRANPIGVHLMKATKTPDPAWEYMAFQSSPEACKVMLERHLTVPWVKSLFGSPEYTKLLLPWESAAAYAESSSKVRPTQYPETFGDVNTIYGKAYTDVQNGKKTARQAIAEIKSQVNDLLKKK